VDGTRLPKQKLDSNGEDNMVSEYDVNEAVLKGKFNKCPVCDKKFKLGEKIILCPIQEPKQGWASVMSIPIHTKCYWMEDD